MTSHKMIQLWKKRKMEDISIKKETRINATNNIPYLIKNIAKKFEGGYFAAEIRKVSKYTLT